MMHSPDLRNRVAALLEPVEQLSVRREIVMALLILSETMILFIYGGTLLAEHTEPFAPLPALLIFATLLIAYQIPHLLETLRIWSPEFEVVMTIGLVGTMVMVIKVGAFPDAALLSTTWIEETVQALIFRSNESERPVWPLVVFVAYAWARGRTRAEPMLETSYSMLRLGTAWVAGGLLLNVLAMPSGAEIFDRVTPAVAAFLLLTLLAIAVSRHQPSQRPADARPLWIWAVVVVLPILVVTAATISVAGILTRETLDLVFALLSPVFWVLGLLIQTVVLLVAIIAFILISPVIWFLERQGFMSLSGFPPIDLAPGTPDEMEEFAQSTLDIADPIRYLIASVLLGIIIWSLVRFAFRRRRSQASGARQQRESLIEWQAAPMNILHRATRWMRRGDRGEHDDPYPPDSRWDGTRRVRRVYRAFLRASGQQRIIRQSADTPDSFAGRVIQVHPDLRPEIEQITASYNLARYSGRPVEAATADRTEHANEQISHALRSRPSE